MLGISEILLLEEIPDIFGISERLLLEEILPCLEVEPALSGLLDDEEDGLFPGGGVGCSIAFSSVGVDVAETLLLECASLPLGEDMLLVICPISAPRKAQYASE